MILRILILAALFTSACSFAQQNFVPGRIVDSDGIEIVGQIDYRNWDKNPTQVLFRQQENGVNVTYRADQIRSFTANNETYLGAIVQVDKASVEMDELSTNRQLDFRTDTVFLLTLVEGAKRLYHYKDPGSRDHFFIWQDGKLDLLIYKRYLVREETGIQVAENNTYVGQLRVYLSDCPELNRALNSVKYTISSLVSFFRKYYKCVGSELAGIKEREKPGTDIGILAGFSATQLKFSSKGFPDLTNGNFSRSVDLTGGLYADFYIPRTLRKVSFHNEVVYTSYSTDGYYLEEVDANLQNEYFSRFAFTYIRYNLLIKYHYKLTPGTQLFIALGRGLGPALSYSNTQIKRTLFFGSLRETEDPAIDGIRKTEHGWVAAAGIHMKRLGAQVRYEPNGGMSKVTSLSSRVHRGSFMLSFDLFQ